MKLGSDLLQDVLGMMWLGIGCWESVIQLVTLKILGNRGVENMELEDLRIGEKTIKKERKREMENERIGELKRWK